MVNIEANKIVQLIHEVPFHGEEDPRKSLAGLGEKYMISYIEIYMKKERGNPPSHINHPCYVCFLQWFSSFPS